jgi:ABC-type enterochelin transport system substrate-binding protein
MKNLIVTILLAVVVAACSSNQTKDANEVASNDAGSSPKTKRVCETVRTNQTGQHLKRVCKEVVVQDG